MDLILTDDGSAFTVKAGSLMIPAVIGRSGLVDAGDKREGDGKTPRGIWPVREILYRDDRISLPETLIKTSPVSADHGWCDDPASACYNRRVTLPFDASHEKLWRHDHAYDVIIPLGYNDDPVIPGGGSAIFFHCLESGRDHTEGCVAIGLDTMLKLLPLLTAQTRMIIDP